MSRYTAEILWERGNQAFLDRQYSRKHVWRFDGGLEIPASSSPQVVPLPLSEERAVDPEEAFVAALSSCHLLWFLSIAAKRGFCVDQYRDPAVGLMARNSEGRVAVTVVTLYPQVLFSGAVQPTWEQVLEMHRKAHQECYIANSVKSEVRCEPQR